jgi:hypothetical protein
MTNSINKLHKFRTQKQLVCVFFDLTFLLEQKSKQKIQGSHTILLKIFILQSDDLSASRTAKIIRTQANSFEEYDFFYAKLYEASLYVLSAYYKRYASSYRVVASSGVEKTLEINF